MSTIHKGQVLFLAENDGNARLYLSIARSLISLAPNFEPVLIDVNPWYPQCVSGGSVFKCVGLRAVSVPSPMSPEGCSWAEYLGVFHDMFCSGRVVCIVVPHELGYARAAIRLARKLRIPAYQIQHGDYLPRYFEKERPPDFLPLPVLPAPHVHAAHEPVARQSVWETQMNLLRQEWNLARRCAKGLVGRLAMRREQRNHAIEKMSAVAGDSGSQATSAPMERDRILADILPTFAGESEQYNFTTDKFGVSGAYWKRRLMATGIDGARIDVIGNLRTDQAFEKTPLAYPELCKQYGLDAAQPTALYFYSPLEEAYRTTIDPVEAIVDSIRALHAVVPEWNMLVLNHPRRPMSALAALKQAAIPRVHVAYAGENLWGLCQHAGLILGVVSSALAEAMVYRKPVVTANYVLESPVFELLTEWGATIPVFHRCNLVDQVRRGIEDRAFVERVLANQAFAVSELVGPFDGQCGRRAAEAITMLAESIQGETE